MVDFSAMSDEELQRFYWEMPINTPEDEALNERIAEELSIRGVGMEWFLKQLEEGN